MGQTAVQLVEKTCTKCGETKPISEFHRNKSSRDGRAWYCALCAAAQVRKRRAERRAEMGEEAWRIHQAKIVRRHRLMGRDERSQESRKAYQIALYELQGRHRSEFDAILAGVRYERGLS